VAIGIFTQSYAVSLVGPIPAIFFFSIVVVFVYIGMHVLLQVANSLNYKKANLEGVAKRILGYKGKLFVLVMLVFSQMSCFIGAILFICKFGKFFPN
jgi:amino acid permease